jgi:hypothetical protein
MGRTLMYGTIVLLAVFVLLSTFILDHGGKSIASVQHVTIRDITTSPAQFEGVPVTTQGTLSFSEEHDHYQLVDPEGIAVLIREYDGDIPLQGILGQEVRVSGEFGSDAELGAYIDAHFAGPVHDDVPVE